MIYSRSALEEVNLSGNLLMNEGVIMLLRGVSIAKSLKKILIADNQFNDDEEVMKALEFCMSKNDKLGKYDLKYNNIGEQGKFLLRPLSNCVLLLGLIKLTEILKTQNHVHDVEIPEKIVAVSESDVANFKELFENFRK